MEEFTEPSETLRLVPPQMQPDRFEAQWIVGFVDGEGCFHIGINPQPEMKTGFQVLPEFTVVQHERDIQLLYGLKAYFGCGVVRRNNGDRMCYRVRSHDHLATVIVPFFEKHGLKSRKNVDFAKFRQVIRMMTAGKHLTSEGIDEIKAIAAQMNRGRER
jgi:hypothetical protein